MTEIDALLNFARAARRVNKAFPETSVADLLQHVREPAESWALTLLQIVINQEERHAAFWLKWKRWRNKREFIKRIARPNVAWVAWGLPPKRKKRKRTR